MGISYDTGTPSAPYIAGGVQRIRGIQPANVVNLPAELYPPDQSIGFVLTDSQSVFGVGNATAFPNFGLILPPDQVGVIDSLTISIDGILITTTVTFALVINGAPVQGYNQLSILPRNGATFVSLTFGPQLRVLVPIGGQIAATAIDNDGAAYTVGMQVHGWFWPADRGV